MSARETAELLLLVGRLVQTEAMTANSAPPVTSGVNFT